MKTAPLSDSKGAAIDKTLDGLELGFRKGSAWMQSNGDQSWEMPPPQIIFIKGKKKARQAILAILAQEVNKARIDELERLHDDRFRFEDEDCRPIHDRINELRKAGLV